MGALIRGLRNIYRNKIRFALITIILSLCTGIYITMAQVSEGIKENLQTVAAEVQTLLEVRAAGATGMGVGVDALPETFFEPARKIPNIKSIETYLYQRTRDPSRAAALSIFVGVIPGETLRLATHGELGAPKIVSGRNFNAQDKGQAVAIIGAAYSEGHNLRVGDTFILKAEHVLLQDRPNPNVVLEDAAFEVIGVFESGFVFGDNQVFMPLDMAQKIFKQEGKASHVFVTVASVEKVPEVEEALRSIFGDKADIISGQDIAVGWAKALRAIRKNSLFSAGVAVAAGALVVLFTMMLVTRERTREIGILKAIGASNGEVAKQFVAEAIGVALLAGLVGLAVFTLGGAWIANVLLGVATSSLNPATAMGGEDPASSVIFRYDLSPRSLISSLAAVIILTLVGSLTSAIRAVRMRPVEAIRHE